MIRKLKFLTSMQILVAYASVAPLGSSAEDPFDDVAPARSEEQQNGEDETLKGRLDVRNVQWLWSVDQVKRAESIDFKVVDVSKNVQLLSGADTIAGHNCTMSFLFFKDELVRIECSFDEPFDLNTYQEIHKALRSKYGDSIGLADRIEAESGMLPPQQRIALDILGLQTFAAFFMTPRTEVKLAQVGGEQMQLCYTPNFQDGKKKEAKMEKESQQMLEKLTNDKL